MLLSAACDGHLGVFDLRKPELYAMSDNFEEDLTSVVICKYGRKVGTCTSEGIINLFSWDWFGDCNDRIVGHPNSIDTMVKYDEDLVITGSEDGLIRAVSILPNKIIAILGDPTDYEDERFHIQKLALSHDKNFLISCSLDDIVKIIDISHLAKRHKEDFDEEGYEKEIRANPNNKKSKKKKRAKKDDKMDIDMNDNEEMKDEGEEDSWESESDGDDSSDSDSDMEEEKGANK